ncbi:MAG: hypothetical protein O7C75_08265, partial [Verrucomicrobia bacterium]|nr:hypothetical protein [Verrucomicrobiota bacterium]
MKKVIGILVALVVLGAIAVFVFSLFAGKIIRKGVVTLGPEVAQVEIELDKAHVSFLSGAGGLEGLKVGNPEGFSGEYAFYAEHLSMKLQPMSILSDKIIIEEILIIGPDIQFEQKLGANNLNQILANVQEFMGPAGEEAEAAKGKKLEIRRFVLQDAKVGVGLGTKPISITIPTIELTDLGTGEEGITAGEVIGVMITEVTGQILAAIAKNPEVILESGGELLKNIGESGSNALKSISSLFG